MLACRRPNKRQLTLLSKQVRILTFCLFYPINDFGKDLPLPNLQYIIKVDYPRKTGFTTIDVLIALSEGVGLHASSFIRGELKKIFGRYTSRSLRNYRKIIFKF